MKNTIAGASFIFASAVCVLALALNGQNGSEEDVIILIAGFIFFIFGLMFFIARDKPSQK